MESKTKFQSHVVDVEEDRESEKTTVAAAPLLTPYKMGKFNLSHRYHNIISYSFHVIR